MAGDQGASMFVGRPQPVEIHHRGIWYSGELLGWRHERDGRVTARVRCVVDGLRHSTWKDLAELRLPDPARPPRREVPPLPAPRVRATPPGSTPQRWTASADGADEDATRPHVLLADLRSRPRAPLHAVVPPAPRRSIPADGPHAGGRPQRSSGEAPAYRPAGLTERRRAHLSTV